MEQAVLVAALVPWEDAALDWEALPHCPAAPAWTPSTSTPTASSDLAMTAVTAGA